MCLIEMTEGSAKASVLSIDRTVNPMIAEVTEYAGVTLHGDEEQKDAYFLQYVTGHVTDGKCSAVFITGTIFRSEAYPMSTAFLKRGGRRVYVGDNLFVKGACFAALEKAEAGRWKNILYMGEDVVRCNIGTELYVDGAVTYYPVAAAGVNWFENAITFDFLPSAPDGMVLTLRSMDGLRQEFIDFSFDGIPKRPEGATRIRIEAYCPSREECVVTAEDRGFGGLYPASGKKWRRSISLIKPNETKRHSAPGESGRLCRIREARVPFPIESVGVSVTTIEELCYFLYHYPELLDSDIIGAPLCDFVEEEFRLPQLANLMRSALRGGEDLMGFILPIFRAAGYLTEEERKAYRQELAGLMKERVSVRMKKKGDALAEYGKYISAMSAYKRALQMIDEKEEDPAFIASLYHNMGAVYMQMLLYEESLDSFKKAYIRFHTKDALRTYLTAAAIARPRSKYEEILRTMHVEDEMRDEIDRSIRAALTYQVPESRKDMQETVDELMKDYRNAAGMPG